MQTRIESYRFAIRLCGGVSLDAELARSTYPKAEKLQSHKATKREKRDRTNDLGSQDATSRSTIALSRDSILALD